MLRVPDIHGEGLRSFKKGGKKKEKRKKEKEKEKESRFSFSHFSLSLSLIQESLATPSGYMFCISETL